MTFPVFYFDANEWFGVVDSAARWFDLRATYPTDEDLDATMAPTAEVKQLPDNYFLGAGVVPSGEIPSFGFRLEHPAGTVRLEDWAKNRGVDLRSLAEARAHA